MTQHPDGKQGVNIEREKYDLIRCTILEILNERGEESFMNLGEEVKRRIGEEFEGSVIWYYTTVKLDMEAKGEIERIPGMVPQRLRLVKRAYC